MASYKFIASTTVGSGGSATIDFTDIPQTYTDLLLVSSLRTDAAVNYQTSRMKINGSTSNMTAKDLNGAGGGAGSATVTTYMLVGYIPGVAQQQILLVAKMFISQIMLAQHTRV
jgi:hypothetical protein